MQNYPVGKEFNTYFQQLLLISYVLIKELNATYNYNIQNIIKDLLKHNNAGKITFGKKLRFP